MRWQEIIESNEFIACPFHSSKFKDLMYHGSTSKDIAEFRRPAEGLWFSDLPSWGGRVYGANLAHTYACYLDVRNPYMPSDDEVDEYYGEMQKIGKFFDQLKSQGYDAYFQGGESGSLAVFDSVAIVDARTGKSL